MTRPTGAVCCSPTPTLMSRSRGLGGQPALQPIHDEADGRCLLFADADAHEP
jgi:hypothetical protein